MSDKILTVQTRHGIGWDVRPKDSYRRMKPDAVKLARQIAEAHGFTQIEVYKDGGQLERVIKVKESHG